MGSSNPLLPHGQPHPAQGARKLFLERQQFLDSADTIATFAAEMSNFLKNSELAETRAFVHSFVKRVVRNMYRDTLGVLFPELSSNRIEFQEL